MRKQLAQESTKRTLAAKTVTMAYPDELLARSG